MLRYAVIGGCMRRERPDARMSDDGACVCSASVCGPWLVSVRGGDRGSLEWPSSETGHRAAVCSSTGPVWVGSAREGITVLLVCYVGPHS